MLIIKAKADCSQITNQAHRVIAVQLCENLYTEEYEFYFLFNPKALCDRCYFVYIENEKDDITKDIPHLNNSERGLLCQTALFGDDSPGWCWEDVRHYKEACLFEIIIIINNELGVGYFVPDDAHINSELKTAILQRLERNGDS